VSVDKWQEQLYGPEPSRDHMAAFARFKRATTGVSIAQNLTHDRERQVAALDPRPRRHEHHALAVHHPRDNWYGACAGFACDYLGPRRTSKEAALQDARVHASSDLAPKEW